MSDALLVMVHGSPRPVANQDMFAVVDVLRERGSFPIVEVGFMELNDPPIPLAIERCVEQGAQRVIAVPYFLHTGMHVTDDLPDLLEEAQARYPDVEFLMGDYLGHDPLLADVIAERASNGDANKRMKSRVGLFVTSFVYSCAFEAKIPRCRRS